jgi:nitrate reductase beta subunit
MYRLLAIAKYEDRYVIPKAHAETARDLEELACAVDYEDDLRDSSGPFGHSSGRPVPVAVETFHALKERQTSEVLIPVDAVRVNLRSWGTRGDSDDE